MRRLPIEAYSQTQILASLDATTLLAETRAGPMVVRFRKLILACGARERFLPFPGWTLPGVFGAGGLQALAKAGYSVGGRRIVVAGSGPLLLAVAAYLHANAAYIQIIAEQAPRGNLARFAGSLLWRQPAKMLEGIALRWQLRGVPYRTGCWPIRADGSDRLASVTLTDGARTWTEPCDSLACGFGLVPNLELPMLLGCAIERGFVKVDEWQQTTAPGIFAIGELTGIGGVDKALIEGQIAGWSAAEQPERGRALFRDRAKNNRFVTLLDETFALRNELRHLADDATIVCRCEDVPLGALKRFTNWRDAKLQTRCGMGPCQGRTCGPALEFLFGWTNDSVRPPIFPTALANLS
jgi:NADPH-dependent 2,4-dienoyl-CoA reductase/sulfur reductase-like enzyme